jgi:hypothetical protein
VIYDGLVIFMRKFAKVYCGDKVHTREIDDKGRLILGSIGNEKCICRTLRKKVTSEADVKSIFRLITMKEVDRVEFIDEE